MAAPLPAPLPPPAIAPPAAPTAAPTTAPIAPSFTTSIVLSFEPASLAAYLLHAAIALWLGAAGMLATRTGVACATFCCAFCSCAARSPAVQFATTRPVTRAVAITTAMAIAVNFQGFIVSPSGLGMRYLLGTRDALPDVAAVPVRVGVAASRRRIARMCPAAGEGRATAPRHDPRAVRRPGVAAGRDHGRAGRPRGLVVARHHLTDVLVRDEALGPHLTEHLLPAGPALLHRRDLIERERLRAVRAPRRRARRRRRSLAPGLGRGRRRRRVLRLEQGPRDFLVAGRALLVRAGGIRWRRDLRIRRGGAEQ